MTEIRAKKLQDCGELRGDKSMKFGTAWVLHVMMAIAAQILPHAITVIPSRYQWIAGMILSIPVVHSALITSSAPSSTVTVGTTNVENTESTP